MHVGDATGADHADRRSTQRGPFFFSAHLPARSGSTSCLAHLAERLRVGSLLLTDSDDDVHEAPVVLQPLLCPARLLLLLLALCDLWRLAAHLAGTRKRAVDLAL